MGSVGYRSISGRLTRAKPDVVCLESDSWHRKAVSECVHIRANKIYNGEQAGAFFFDGGMGTFEDNDVWGNQDAGLQIIEASDPLVTLQ